MDSFSVTVLFKKQKHKILQKQARMLDPTIAHTGLSRQFRRVRNVTFLPQLDGVQL